MSETKKEDESIYDRIRRENAEAAEADKKQIAEGSKRLDEIFSPEKNCELAKRLSGR